jgi:phosphate transport system protein
MELLMADHILKKIDADLAGLRGQLHNMAALVREQVGDALTLVDKCYLERGLAVDRLEDKVNELHLLIDREVTHFIALHQPNASDLRAVVGVSRLAADFEQIGNLACEVARSGERLHRASRKQVPLAEPLAEFHGGIQALLLRTVDSLDMNDRDAWAKRITDGSRIAAQSAPLATQLREYLQPAPERLDAVLEALDVVRTLQAMVLLVRRITLHLIYMSVGADLRHATDAQIAKELGA